MKKSTKLFIRLALLLVLPLALASCELGGLDLQKNWEFEPHVLDPHINKTALQLLEERSYDPKSDSIFYLFRKGIEYAGINMDEYSKTGRTFIFLHNNAILDFDDDERVVNDCYFGRYRVPNLDQNGDPILDEDGLPTTRPAKSWNDYPQAQVRNWLLYLIANGEYSFDNLGAKIEETTTLLPAGADSTNPEGIITFNVVNDRNSRFRINDFFGTVRYTEARTGGIISTNGPVHVVDELVEYGEK